mgnify:CR=1 FL=1
MGIMPMDFFEGKLIKSATNTPPTKIKSELILKKIAAFPPWLMATIIRIVPENIPI